MKPPNDVPSQSRPPESVVQRGSRDSDRGGGLHPPPQPDLAPQGFLDPFLQRVHHWQPPRQRPRLQEPAQNRLGNDRGARPARRKSANFDPGKARRQPKPGRQLEGDRGSGCRPRERRRNHPQQPREEDRAQRRAPLPQGEPKQVFHGGGGMSDLRHQYMDVVERLKSDIRVLSGNRPEFRTTDDRACPKARPPIRSKASSLSRRTR